MKEYEIQFGFMRGRRGDIIKVNDEDAVSLLDSGLIAPVKAKAEAKPDTTAAKPTPAKTAAKK